MAQIITAKTGFLLVILRYYLLAKIRKTPDNKALIAIN
jgi:hypothetical protein